MFEQIEVKSLTDEVEAAIYSYIKKEKLTPGDSLPKENELAQMLGISRPMVREAVSRLRMLGVISSRKRRGMIVAKPKIFETMRKVMNPQFLNQNDQQDFFNLRLTLEIGMGDLLAANVSKMDLAQMQDIVDREKASPDDFTLYQECDYEFHSCLYKATGNQAIMSFQIILYRFFSDIETRKGYASPDYANRFNDPNRITHLDVLNAVRTQNPLKINEIMQKHLHIHFLQE